MTPITWQEAEISANEDAEETEESSPRSPWISPRSRDSGAEIVQFSEAETSRRPIVLWVYTASIERSMQRAREASDAFFENVLNTPEATAELATCLTLKIEGADLDRDLARNYDIRRNSFPQLLIYDFQGERLYRLGGGHTAQDVARHIQIARQRCEQLAERLDRDR